MDERSKWLRVVDQWTSAMFIPGGILICRKMPSPPDAGDPMAMVFVPMEESVAKDWIELNSY